MPRAADHDARRRQVVDALLAVVVRDGLAEASLSAVADEARVSVGLIQRYFPSKRELCDFAFAQLVGLGLARLSRVEPGPDRVYRLLEALLPLTERRLVESTVWLAFLGAAVPDAQLMAPHRAAMDRLHAELAVAFAATSTTPRTEAKLLTALVDGLVVSMVSNPAAVPPAAARACLRLAVDRALGT